MTGTTIAGQAALVGLIAVAAVGSAWWMVPEAFPALTSRPRSFVVAPGSEPRVLPGTSAPPASAASATVAPIAATPAATEAPRFDVARVGARGMVVTAGRAAPGAEVILYAGGRELGRARADSRGEWVILPVDPLPAGPRELALVARSPGGDMVAARETLVLVVPETAAPASASARTATGRDAVMAPAEALAGQGGVGAHGPPLEPFAVLLPQGATGAVPRVLQGAAGTEDAAARQRLGLDAVEYDDAGAMRFAGTAPPGSKVRVYVGQDHAGEAVADAGGRWQLMPAQQPIIGRHTLRLDQVAASGTVAARIEVPFQRDRLPESTFAADQVVVQPGQSLWRIARRVYGRGMQYAVIYQANREQIRDPGRIYPGQVFAMPGEAAPGQGAGQGAVGDPRQTEASRSR